jgi:PAS domain S-box-containing protein
MTTTTNKNILSHDSDIIIIDDEIPNLKLLTQLLTEQGYKARPAERPQLAIDSALMHPPALILLDVTMPEMDGFEVCRRLKQDERTRDIPIIFISALQDVQDRIRGFEAGGVDFISKPFQAPEVLARVRTHMELRNMQLNLEEIISERTAELENEINERKQAEVKIRQSEEKFKGVFNSMMDVFSRADLEGKCLLISPSVFDVVGYRPEEIMGRNYGEFYARSKDWELLNKRLLETGGIQNIESEVVKKDGTRIIISSNAKVIHDGSGKPVGIESVFRDITERRQDEEKLKSSEEKFRTLIRNIPDVTWTTDREGNTSFISDNILKIYGYSPERIYANPKELWFERIHPDDVENVKRAFVLLFEANDSRYDIEYRTKRKDGQWIWLRDRSIATYEKCGVTYADGILSDITDRKTADEQLKQYQQRLRALASQLTLAEEQERRRIAEDLHDHIGQSLAFARLRMAVAQKTTSRTKLAEILEEISGSLLQSIRETRQLIFDLSSPSMNEIGLAAAISEWLEEQIQKRHGLEIDFIDECGKVSLHDDTRAIVFRSVRELLANVVKHAQASRVSVGVRKTDTHLKIAIKDDGVGFDFLKAFGTSRTQGGFGLFSIQERMSDLGGGFGVESEPDQGCRVELTVPLEKEEEK